MWGQDYRTIVGAVKSFGYNTICMGSYFKANTLSWTYWALNERTRTDWVASWSR